MPVMSTKSRQTIYGGPIMGAKIRAEGARKRAAEAVRESDRHTAASRSRHRPSGNALMAASVGLRTSAATHARVSRACDPPSGLAVSTQRADVVEAADSRLNRCQTQSNTGQINAPVAIEARIAEIGRSKNGRMLPSDLINDVTNACSTMVPITIPSTIAATG